LCGDFNDTPNSYSYFTIRGKLRDAFLEKGFGFGRTYSGIAPTLRIDYIFASPSIEVLSFRRIKKVLSDHYPIIARLRPEGGHQPNGRRPR
jgi:endonuclease/exonuclease/phosphatase family metal-dependent hydrolase